MKELERTKRISISAVLFLLVVVIAVLTFEKPAYIFKKNAEATLEKITSRDYILSQKDFENIDNSKYVLIDIRSNYEYAKGHIESAINISAHDVFEKENAKILKDISNKGKLAILYGDHPDTANSAWMLLYQMGYENVKVLCLETSFANNQFQVKNVDLEKPTVNYAQVMQSSMGDKTKTVTTQKPKKVITAPKKKKRVAEGGC